MLSDEVEEGLIVVLGLKVGQRKLALVENNSKILIRKLIVYCYFTALIGR